MFGREDGLAAGAGPQGRAPHGPVSVGAPGVREAEGLRVDAHLVDAHLVCAGSVTHPGPLTDRSGAGGIGVPRVWGMR